MFRQASSEVWRTVVASALAQMGVACWEYDLASGELWWSDNAGPLVGRTSGYTPSGFEEAESIFVREEDRPFDIESVMAHLKPGPVEVDRRAVLPDGTIRWTHHRYFLIVDQEGEPERLAGMISDIEARKRREAEDSTLVAASEALSRSLDMEATLATIAGLVVPELADWCVVELLEDGQLRPVVTAHVDPERVRWAEAIQAEYPQDMTSPIGSPAVVRSGQPELYPDISDEMLVAVAKDDQRLLDILRNVGYRSVMVVPLSVRGEAIGAVTMVMAESQRRFDEQSLRFAERLARHMAVAIDNARLHGAMLAAWEGQRKAVETLQTGLSPDPLPDLPGIDLAAHYQIGGTDKVGGDWYDAFVTENGEVAFVVGDVVGRGVPAVAAMSRYRNALKMALFRGDGPGRALTLVNRFGMAHSPKEAFATVICMTYRPGSRQLLGARAGHPMAMLRSSGGEVERLWEVPDPPFSVDAGYEYEERTARIDPGAVLVLYTDGLIERRDERIDVSLDRLASAVAGAPAVPTEVVTHLLDRLLLQPTEDDVAVLVVGFGG